jgi:chemotaxis protein histidine kinase CheA
MLLDAETLIVYFEETNHSLQEIEKELIVLEDMAANVDMSFAKKIYRKMHIIKSGASILGLPKIKELSQKLENVLGLICDGKLVPNPEIINILLQGCDHLMQLSGYQKTVKKEIDIDEQSVMLTGLTSAVLPDDKKKSVTQIKDIPIPGGTLIFHIPEFNIIKVLDQEKKIYIVEYDLINDVQEKNNTPLDIVRLVQQHGEIIDSLVDIKSVGTLEDVVSSNRMPYFILLASSLTHEQLLRELNLNSNQIIDLKNEFDDLFHSKTNDSDKPEDLIKKQKTYQSTCCNEYQHERISDLTCELYFASCHLQKTTMIEHNQLHDISVDRIKTVLNNIKSHVLLNYQLPVSKGFWKLIRNIHDYSFQSGNNARLRLFCDKINMDRRMIKLLIQPLTEIIIKMIHYFVTMHDSALTNDMIQIDLITHENENLIFIEIFSHHKIPTRDNFVLDCQSEIDQLKAIRAELKSYRHDEKGPVVQITLPHTFSIINGWSVIIDNQNYIIPRINVCTVLDHSNYSKSTDIQKSNDYLSILYKKQWIPIVTDLYKQSCEDLNAFFNQKSILICTVGNEQFALPVDQVEYSEIDVVLQPLDKDQDFNALNSVSVATCLLSNRNVAFVPDMGYLGHQSKRIKPF